MITLTEQLVRIDKLTLNINDTVLSELETDSFYLVWRNNFERMQSEHGGDIAMVRLLKIAEQEYSPEFTQLDQMALEVIWAAERDFNDWEDELYNSRENGRSMSYVDVDRPADLYRRWMKPLRFIEQYNFGANEAVKNLIRDLQEIQSLPYGELDSPDWVDPYTGEVSPIEERIELINAPRDELVFNKLSVESYVKRMVKLASEMDIEPELAERATRIFFSGDEADDLVQNFIHTYSSELEYLKHVLTVEAETLQASESYDMSDGLDDYEYSYDDNDTRVPDFMEFQNDMRMREYFSLRHEIADVINGLRQEINDAVKTIELRKNEAFCKLRNVYNASVVKQFLDSNNNSPEIDKMLRVLGNYAINTKRDIFTGVREQVVSSVYASEFLDKLQEFIDRGEHIPDVVLMFLSFQNGLCFLVEDAIQIEVPKYGTLFDFIEINGDEIIENFNDPASVSTGEPSWEFLQNYAETVASEYGSTGVDIRKQNREKINVFNTPEFIEGTILAASSLKNATRENIASFAWEYMREHISPRGNALYHQIIRQGGERKSAMRAFYRQAFSETRIKSIRPDGLVLDTGRVVNWTIAKRKIEFNEIAFDNGDKDRLKGILEQKDWGKELQSVL